MLDNVGLRYPHRASGAKAPRTLRPLPLLRFAVSATGGAHLCSIQYYLRFWPSSCRTSLAVSALRIMRYCLKEVYDKLKRLERQPIMKSRRKYGFQFMTILYFLIVFCMCVSRFNVIMTIMGGQLTRVEEINLLPFHSIRENLKYGRSPVSWDMLYNMVMFVPFGVIYCYYQKNFRVYKAVGMSCLTTFFIESAQLVLKTGVVDIDDLIVNTLGSLTGIVVYVILQQISFKNQKFEIHELIDISATMLPPMFVAFIAEMFLGDGSLKLLPVHCVVLLCYGIFVYVFLIRDFTRKAKVYYLACYVGAFYLSRVLL